MKKNEVLLFKQWDSDRTLTGRMCFHTSFKDPNAPWYTSPRQSIETRAIAYFPDHELNTCLPIEEEKNENPPTQAINKDNKQTANRINQIIGSIEALDTWPLAGKMWAKEMHATGKTGAKYIAEILSQDYSGQLGLRNLSKRTKEKIVSGIMKDDTYFECLRKNIEKL